MPICPSCGSAAAGAAATCANCGRPVAPFAIGDVLEDTTSTGPGHSPWGAGRVAHVRELPRISRGWLTAGRVLIAPTLGLVLAAVIGSAAQGDETAGGLQMSWSADGFQNWMSFVLTSFGAPWRYTLTMASTKAGGTAVVTSTSTHLTLYVVTLSWLLLLWCGLYLAARARRAAGVAEPPARAVALQALRTGAVSAAVALLLGWLSTNDGDSGALTGDAGASLRIGTALLPLTVVAGLAAAVLVLAVDGAAALRAEAGRRRWLGGLLLAWQHAFRVIGTLLVLLTAVALVVQLADGDTFPRTDMLGLVSNNGLLIYGVGSGATALTAGAVRHGRSSMSLWDLGTHSAAWWLAVIPVLGAALALGWSAHRGRLTPLDRARLAGVYAALTAALVLGTSMWSTTHSTVKSALLPTPDTDLFGWSLVSVLVAAAGWAAFGALAVPAALDWLRGTPVPPAPPRPYTAPAAPPVPAGPPVIPGQQATDELGAHGSVELVVEEPPAAVPLGKDEDPHAVYRRPDAD